MLSTLKRWWGWRAIGRDPFPPDEWALLSARLPLLAGYPAEDLARLRELTGRFLREKAIHAAGGLELDGPMCRLVALQACVPILNLGLDWYRGWVSVIVYPDEFLARQEWVDEDGVVHQVERELSGESWPEGPVVLSWSDAVIGAEGEEWGNVVVHEMAHKLDLLNGEANGMPPLHPGMSRPAWTGSFSRAYEDFWSRVDRGEPVPFDDYAADDPAEFFAVLSEAFFLHPHDVLEVYPEVYARLRELYRQDPAARLEAVLGGEGAGERL